jgi:5-methylcytosine-specific restriction enzyme A
MPYGFEPGRIYNRRADIHARFGGQQQGGIITPAQHSLVIIITGEEGLEHGYADRYRADGVFEYFGEGQVGDMRLRAGNRAIAEHSSQGKDLLLFRKTSDGLRFEGEMVCEGYQFERAADRTGTERDAIVFELRALEAVVEKLETEPVPPGVTLEELRQLALRANRRRHRHKANGTSTNGAGMSAITYWRAPRENVRDAVRPHHFCAQTAHLT